MVLIFKIYYVFLTISEANWFRKVREGRSNGNVADAETFDGIAEVMIIVQVIFELFGECACYYLIKPFEFKVGGGEGDSLLFIIIHI